MSTRLRIALTADLHWGHHDRGAAAVRLLVEHLRANPPGLLILGGDIGTAEHFADCLALFADIPCRKALTPGNHDVWVNQEDERDSLALYDEDLAAVSQQHGFHYLDHGPLILGDAGLAIVGSMNWYDYSWTIDALREQHPQQLHRLKTKRFTMGRHNDANFVRWPLDDAGFTRRAVERFERHLIAGLEQVERAIVVTHHPPFIGLGFPRSGQAISLDGLLWGAFSGNRAMEEVLARHSARIAFAFCGHTHRARENEFYGIRGHNIGGDYHFKRLLMLDWSSGTVTAHQFGDPER